VGPRNPRYAPARRSSGLVWGLRCPAHREMVTPSQCALIYADGVRKAEKRSPLKAPPVRLPGQSVAEEIERLRESALGDDLVLVADRKSTRLNSSHVKISY